MRDIAGSNAVQGSVDHSLSESSSSSGVLPSMPRGAGERRPVDVRGSTAGLLGFTGGLESRRGPEEADQERAAAIRRMISEEAKEAALYQMLLESKQRSRALQQLTVEAELASLAAAMRAADRDEWALLAATLPSPPSALEPWHHPERKNSTASVLGGFSRGVGAAASTDHTFALLEPKGAAGNLPTFTKGETEAQQAALQISSGANKRKADVDAPSATNFPPAPGDGPGLHERSEKKFFGCAICRVGSDTHEEFDQHIRSELHRNAELALTKSADAKASGSSLFCNVCKLSTNGEIQFGEHCRGKKHRAVEEKEALLRAKTGALSELAPTMVGVNAKLSKEATVLGLENGNGNNKTVTDGVSSNDNEGGGGESFFSLCNLRTNNHEQLEVHHQGGKHKAAMEMAKLVSCDSACFRDGYQQLRFPLMDEYAYVQDKIATKTFTGSNNCDNRDEGCDTIFLCSLCKLSFTGEEELKIHYCQGRECKPAINKAELAGAEERGGGFTIRVTSAGDEDRKPPKAVAAALGLDTLDGVEEGTQAAVKTVTGSTDNGGWMWTGDSNYLFCSLCKFATNSQKNMEIHKRGRKHKAKVSAASGQKFVCTICWVTTTSSEHLTKHFNGAKHKAREQVAASIQQFGKCTEQNQQKIENQPTPKSGDTVPIQQNEQNSRNCS